MIKENAAHTIEIGLAFGFSALDICEGLVLNGDSGSNHVAIDPWQPSGYADRGLEILEDAGVKLLMEFHGKESHLALPHHLDEGMSVARQFHKGRGRIPPASITLDLRMICGIIGGKGGGSHSDWESE